MTISPYDNLPTGADSSHAEVPSIDVTPAPNTEEPLQYVDVDFKTLEPDPPAANVPKPSPDVPKPHPQAALAKTIPFEKSPGYSKYTIKNLWGHQEYILPFEETLLVPDTMPDMAKILFAEGRVDLALQGCPTYEKGDFLTGDITVYTVYQPASEEKIPVDVVKSIIAFKTDKYWEKAQGNSCKAQVSIGNITAEMVNERKFTVKGQLLIKRTELATKELKVLDGVEDDAFVQAKGVIQVTGLQLEKEEATEISQEIKLRDDQPSPVKILKETFRIVENHRQITSGKLVINASIHSQALYLGEEDGVPKLGCMANKTDFSQFIMAGNTIDPNHMKISFHSNDLKLAIVNQDTFLLQGMVTTCIQGYENQDISITPDAYHKTRDIKFDLETEELSAIVGTVSGEISSREVMEPGDADRKPETLLCGSCRIASIDGTLDRDRIVLEGTLPIKILALDETQMPFLIEKTIPLRGALEMPGIPRNADLCIAPCLKDFWFDEINSRQLEVNITLSIRIWASVKETFKTLENLCFVDSGEPAKRVPMALYTVSPGDTLWDVAKRYKTDSDTLADLNQLDPQRPLVEGMKLFIAK